MNRARQLSAEYRELAARLEEGGGADKVAIQHARGKLVARERIKELIDPGTTWIEIGLLLGYEEYGGKAPGAGVVTGIGELGGRAGVVVA